MTGFLIKKGNLNTETDLHRRKIMWRKGWEEDVTWRQRAKVMRREAKDSRRLPPEAGREAWNRFSLAALKGANPANALILDYQPPRLWGNKLPNLWYFVWQPEETNPHLHQSRWTWFSVGLFEVRDCTLFDFGSSGLLQYLAGKSNTSEIYKGFLGGSVVKNLPSNERTQVQTLVWKVRSCMPQLRPAAAKNNVS